MIKIHIIRYIGILTFLLFLSTASALSGNINELNAYADDFQKEKEHLHVLFLGDKGHHRPDLRIQQLIPYFASQGIRVTYTDRQEDINAGTLAQYDVFMIYGNRSGLSAYQEKALLDFAYNGGGVVAVHAASASFNDSDAFVNLVGGAFKAHGVGVFTTNRLEANHPVFEDVPEIESWDETYVHMKHNPDKTVLSVREEGDHREPWTWVRNHGDGRVFYTAWGHDERTWGNAGFQKLLEQAVRWTAGDWALDADFSPPELTYGEGKLPYYPEGEPWGTVGDPITEVQNPLPPEQSKHHIVTDPSFTVELFAADPEIINPIDMTWDEKGRLWIAETVDYPNNFEENRTGNDRIKILEDTNGDGKADKITLFAEGLNIPTSIVLSDGGVIVAQAPDFLFLKDTTGDDKADLREVLFTGWGTFDTHAGPNNLHYGFDNQIWGAVGYSAFEGTVGGKDHEFSSGFYRFMPDGSTLEYISSTTNNTWGLGFSEDGLVFGSTANNDVPVYSAIPNRFYNYLSSISVESEGNQRRRGGTPRLPRIASDNSIYPITRNVRQVDQHGRYTAGSGLHIYAARDFPKSYWNRKAFISEPTGHLLGEFILEPEGSGYRAHNAWNLLSSQDEWFSPIQAKVGPDGALWVIDWYNLIIQHNPFPDGWERGEGNAYITELRDRQHARIYRILNKDGNHDSDFNLENASPEQLVEALRHDNLFWRLTAQRLLVERGESDVLPHLFELVQNKKVDDIGLNPGALHAIWTIHGLGVLDGSNRQALDVVYSALHHPVSAVQRAALMVIPRNEESLNKILSLDFVPDPVVPGDMNYAMPTRTMMASNPKVRLASLLALAEMPESEKTGIAAAEMLISSENARDRWLRDAIAIAGSQNDQSFVSHILKKRIPEQADSTYKANVDFTVQQVSKRFASEGDTSNEIIEYLSLLENGDTTIGNAFLTGIAEGWQEGQQPSFNTRKRNQLREIGESLPEIYRDNLKILADKWGSPNLFGTR